MKHTHTFHSSILFHLPVFGKQRSKLYCVFVPVRQPFNGVFDYLLVRVAQLSKCFSCPCFEGKPFALGDCDFLGDLLPAALVVAQVTDFKAKLLIKVAEKTVSFFIQHVRT